MKNLRITVNGVSYDVQVEELGESAAVSAPAPAAAPKAAPAAPKAPAAAAGSIKVTAPMPGTILSVKAEAGKAVKKGDVLVVLEATKMENEICAPEDGTVASVHVEKGANVETGALLVSMG